MTRRVTEHENDRRRAMSSAKGAITLVMLRHNLTPAEWAEVLQECLRRITILRREDESDGLPSSGHSETTV